MTFSQTATHRNLPSGLKDAAEDIPDSVLNFAEKTGKQTAPIEYWMKDDIRQLAPYIQLKADFRIGDTTTIDLTLSRYDEFSNLLISKTVASFKPTEVDAIRDKAVEIMQRKSTDLQTAHQPSTPSTLPELSRWQLVDTTDEDTSYAKWEFTESPYNGDANLAIIRTGTTVPEVKNLGGFNLLYSDGEQTEMKVLTAAPLTATLQYAVKTIQYGNAPFLQDSSIREFLHDWWLFEDAAKPNMSKKAKRLQILGVRNQRDLNAALSLQSKYTEGPEHTDYYRTKAIVETVTRDNGDLIFAPEELSGYDDWLDKFDAQNWIGPTTTSTTLSV